MDPVSAVGLAAAVLQFIDFSSKLIKGSYEVYKSGSNTSPNHVRVRTVLRDLQAITDNLQLGTRDDNEHVKALKQLASDCAEVSQHLSDILRGLEKKEGNKAWNSVQVKWKELRSEREIASIEEKLNKYRLEMLLRLSMILGQQQLSIAGQLDFMKGRAFGLSGMSVKLLQEIRDSVQESKALTHTLIQKWRISEETEASLTGIRLSLSALQFQLAKVPIMTTNEHRVLRRLYFDSMFTRQESIADAETGTYKWLLEGDKADDSKHEAHTTERQGRQETRDAFLSWLRSGKGVYHISGKAGSGKSTLMKFLCAYPRLRLELEAWAGEKKLAFANFFFWKLGQEEQASLDGLYRSLLFEVLNEYPELIKEVFPKQWADAERNSAVLGDGSLRFSELRAAMNELMRRRTFPHHRFCFFIDGLDEFEGNSIDHWALAKSLRAWTTCPDVKICVSSRPHTEFLDAFESEQRLQLHDLTTSDIRQYIVSTFQNFPKGPLQQNDIEPMVSDIIDRADGVFLWVRLVLHQLQQGLTHRLSAKSLMEKMQQMPSGLEALLGSLLNGIEKLDRKLSYRMLYVAATKSVSNAIAYTWIENLDDPNFPYNVPSRGYSDGETKERLDGLRHQLDGLTRGLLEMGIQENKWIADVYFRHEVRFFHRSVHEYMKDWLEQDETRSQMGAFDLSDAVERLLLALFKHARTKASYFEVPQFWSSPCPYFVLIQLLDRRPEELSQRTLDEIRGILEYYESSTFSYPGEVQENNGVIAWGCSYLSWSWRSFIRPRSESTFLPALSVSFLHTVAVYGYWDYVMKHISQDPRLLSINSRGSFLLAASLPSMPEYRLPKGPQPDIVRDLLRQGASPEHKNDVYRLRFGARSARKGPEGQETETISDWAVFLWSMWFHSETDQLDAEMPTSTDRPADNGFQVMEELLRAGADPNAYFLVQFMMPASSRTAALAMEDFLLLAQPANLTALLDLVKRKESLILRAFSAIRFVSSDSTTPKLSYPPISLPQFMERQSESNPELHGIWISGEEITGDFELLVS